jgi:predicted ATPase
VRFSRIVLENWRNFGHVDVPLQNRAFLVGPNASGKSNFLDAFRFLRDLVVPGGGFEQAVISRGGVSSIRNLAARHPSTDVVIQIWLEDRDVVWNYRIAFAQDGRQRSSRPILKQECIWRNDIRVLDRPDPEDMDDEERLRQTHLEQTFANREFREIVDFFTSVQYFHLVPQLVRDPERSLVRENDPYGSDFLEQMARTAQRTREARLRQILKSLKVAVPQLIDLELEKDERGIPHLRGKYQHWRPKGAWQTESDFSDGTLRLMGLLWSLLDDNDGGLLLLEEPELSLHPAVVRRIPQMMLRVQRERKRAIRQVFLSTHSSDLLSDEGIAPDEILLFIPTQEGSEVKVGAEIAQIRDMLGAGIPPGEAVIPYTKPPNVEQLSLFGD